MCNVIKFNKDFKPNVKKVYYVAFKNTFMPEAHKSFDEAFFVLTLPNGKLNPTYKDMIVKIYESIGTFEDKNQQLKVVWSSF